MTHMLKRLAALLRTWSPPDPGPDEDPSAGVREPRRGGPGGRESAVAVGEPEADTSTVAVGRAVSR